MKKISKSDKYTGNIAIAATIGIVISCVVSVLVSLIGTTLISRGSAGEERYGFISLLCWILSSVVGCGATSILAKNKSVLACAITVAGYLFVLIGCNIMFLDGKLMALWKGVLLSVGGMLLTVYLFSGKKGNKKKKISYRPR